MVPSLVDSYALYLREETLRVFSIKFNHLPLPLVGYSPPASPTGVSRAEMTQSGRLLVQAPKGSSEGVLRTFGRGEFSAKLLAGYCQNFFLSRRTT